MGFFAVDFPNEWIFSMLIKQYPIRIHLIKIIHRIIRYFYTGKMGENVPKHSKMQIL